MGNPWYQHHYIGEFAGDAIATANCNSRGWGAAPPNGLLYFDTLTGTLRYANGGVWNALGGGGPVTKHDYGTMHTTQPLVQRFIGPTGAGELATPPECNAQRRVAVDSAGNKYCAYYNGFADMIILVKVTTDMKIHPFYLPLYIPINDFCLCMNSLDELVLVYEDGWNLWVSKCPTTGTNLYDAAWTVPTQLNVNLLAGPYGVVAAIDSNDLLWVLWGDITNPIPPSFACMMYYSTVDCSVFNTSPTVIIADTAGPSFAYPRCWALEIDGADIPHVAFGLGAVAPAHNIWHTYYTLGAWTLSVQMETQVWSNPWENLSMVITPSGRVSVTATQDNALGYYGVFMDAPYAVAGKDPPGYFNNYSYWPSYGGPGRHQISINDVGQIIHGLITDFGIFMTPTRKLELFRTTTDFVPDKVDGFGNEHYFFMVFDLEGEGIYTYLHWAYYNHNRPNYDYPLIMFLRAALIFDVAGGSSPYPMTVEFIWSTLGE